MAIYEVTIPQLGEGLQEARLVRLLKKPGDTISRDEPIFEMETDKAVTQVEAPVAGVLLAWTLSEGDVAPIGAVVGRIESDEPVPAGLASTHPEPAAMARDTGEAARLPMPRPASNALLPPRTRAYAQSRGVTEDALAALADQLGRKVLPADVDKLLEEAGTAAEGPAAKAAEADLIPLSPSQRTLVYRLQQRSREAIPATEEVRVSWEPVDRLRDALRRHARRSAIPPATPFLVFAWCVAQAAERFPVMRCTYAGDGMLRRHAHLNLGIAVAREDDELLTGVVPAAETLSFQEFVRAATDAVKRARAGEDQASDSVQISLSNLAGLDIVRATPVVVPPAIATVYLGSVQEEARRSADGDVVFDRVATVSMTFDHRVMNGVGAARLLAEIRRQVTNLDAAALGLSP